MSAPRRTQDGADGFTDFVRAARPALRRAAYFLTAGWPDAEDLVQDALVAVYRRWNQLRYPQAATAYARRTLIHAYISDRRHHRWRAETLCPPADLPDRGVDDHRAVDTAELHAVLAALPPRQRAVVVLRFLDDLSVADTAELLGCTPTTVRSQQSRALRTARGILTADAHPPAQ